MHSTAEVRNFDRAVVAGLSAQEIFSLSQDELVQVVRAGRIPFPGSGVEERLEFQDRETLERLAFLARRCCRNRRG